MLVRLLYASRATPGATPDDLLAILRKSRSNNPPLGITGVLCCCTSENIYLQVLEGGRSAVNRLYHRIAADPRHHDVELLAYEEIGERSFANWSMGQINMALVNPGLLLKYSERAALDPLQVPGKASLALLQELMASASMVGQA